MSELNEGKVEFAFARGDASLSSSSKAGSTRLVSRRRLPNLNIYWGHLMVEELVRNGCDYFCVSPGSQSTSLTTVVARHPKVQSHIFYDERGAAFHALGYVRATHRPFVWLAQKQFH